MTVTPQPKEAKRMAESKAHSDWQKVNTVAIRARLQRSTDADIIAYLEGKAPATEIKKALRLMIALEQNKKSVE